MNQLVRYGAYPFVLTLGLALHFLLLENQFGVQVAAYGPVIVGALAVAVLEWMYPYRKQWYADGQELAQDAVYMALIQGVLPKILAVTATLLFRANP